MRMIPLRFLSVAGLLGGVLLQGPATAQVATSLLNEGDAYPAGGAGHIVTGLNNTAVNHGNGFAVSLNSSDGTTTLSHIWGNAAGGPGANIRTEGTFGSLVQTSFESFYGIDDAGSVCYSASGTGGPVGSFDSVWKDDTPLALVVHSIAQCLRMDTASRLELLALEGVLERAQRLHDHLQRFDRGPAQAEGGGRN